MHKALLLLTKNRDTGHFESKFWIAFLKTANNTEVAKSRARNSMFSVVFPNCTLGEHYLLLVNAVQNLPRKPVNIRQVKKSVYQMGDINAVYVKVF